MRLRACLLCTASLCAAASNDLGCPGNTTIQEVVAGYNLTGKLAIVTGGDSGLGLSISHAFASRGASLVIATHNLSKGERAAQEVATATGSDVRAMLLDVSSLASVRKFAALFQDTFGQKLDYLINDAGITHPSVFSQDGFELVFETDYLGHFLLTELLLPALRKSSPSRIVNVASGAHENACETAGWPADCFKDFTYLPPPLVPKRNVTVHYKSGAVNTTSSSYGIAKWLQIQHAAELTIREKHAGVSAFSLTPGFAFTSMTKGANASSPEIRSICKAQIHPDPSLPANPCPFTSDQGAAVVGHCALAADVASAGAYFSRTWACGERPVVLQGMPASMRAEIYERSLMWVGLTKGVAEAVTYV